MPDRIPSFNPFPDTGRDYERRPARQEDKNFYSSKRWRDTRAAFLRKNPLCVDCEKAGRFVPALHVHHLVERKEDPSRSFDWTNLEALCPSCHGRKRRHS